MTNLAKTLQEVNMSVFQKIAFIDDAFNRNFCPVLVAEIMQTIDYNNEKGYWILETESMEERKERKELAKTEHYEEISMNRRMSDAYADECTSNGR